MNTDTLHVRNTITGKVGTVRRSIFENKVFNDDVLVEVDRGAKPVAEGLHRPQSATDYLASRTPTSTPDPVDTDSDEDADETTEDN